MSYVEQLTPEERDLVRRCLAHVIGTPELDHDFQTRTGVSRAETAEVLMRWREVDDHDEDGPACLAINNALNEVANGLSLAPGDWHRLGAERAEVASVLARYATVRGWRSTGIRWWESRRPPLGLRSEWASFGDLLANVALQQTWELRSASLRSAPGGFPRS
jgi:hypothetical protein